MRPLDKQFYTGYKGINIGSRIILLRISNYYTGQGSFGELLSGFISFKEIKVLTEEDFEKLDELHFKTENELIALIKSLQKKQKDGNWQTEF